jgi:hypothetical protein
VPPHTQIMLPTLYNHTRITCGHLSIFRSVLFVLIFILFFKSGNFFIGKHILYYKTLFPSFPSNKVYKIMKIHHDKVICEAFLKCRLAMWQMH